MKKQYHKPMFVVEYYTLTQAIASCGGIKIGFSDSKCVEDDKNATDTMRDWAIMGGFIDTTVTNDNRCSVDLSGFVEGSVDDMMCYFTSVNAAFTS